MKVGKRGRVRNLNHERIQNQVDATRGDLTFTEKIDNRWHMKEEVKDRKRWNLGRK